MARIDLKTAPLQLLQAMAKAIALEMDRGSRENADLLEEVFIHIQTARQA